MRKKLAFIVALTFYASLLPWAGAENFNYRVHNIVSDNGAITGFRSIGDNSFADNLTVYANDVIFPTGTMDNTYKLAAPYVDVKAKYGAKADGVTDDAPAINAALAVGGLVVLPPGIYKVNSSLVFQHEATTLVGYGAALNSSNGTYLDFSSLPNDCTAIVLRGAAGKAGAVRNLYIFGATGTGGSAVAVGTTSGVTIENVHGTWNRGATGYAVKLGDESDVQDNAVIESKVSRVIFATNGTGVLVGAGSTSNDVSNVYIMNSPAAFKFKRATYNALTACAADSGTGWAYTFTNSSNNSLVGCGAEGNAKGLAYLDTSTEISLIAVRGVGNNTSADNTIGSYVHIADNTNCYSISIIGGRDTSPNAATSYNIYGGATTQGVEIIGYNPVAFTKGIGGDATWMKTYLNILGGDNNRFGPTDFTYQHNLRGTTGGFTTTYKEVTGTATATASFNISLGIPVGSRILGAQLRVDNALTSSDGGTAFSATIVGGPTFDITASSPFDKNTKVSINIDNSVNPVAVPGIYVLIACTGGKTFAAGGVVRVIIYYETFTAMADAP